MFYLSKLTDKEFILAWQKSFRMKRSILYFLLICAYSGIAQAPRKFYTRFGGYGHDIGYGVIQTLNGQYAVTGSTSSFGNGNTDVYLALVDSMGWVRWEKSYGGFNNDIGKSIIQLKDSGFVIAGYTNSFGSGGYDMFVVRTDKTGSLVWQKTFGGMDWDFGNCVKEVNNGDSLVICGSTYSYGYGKSDGYIVKTDINGNFQWQKTYGGAEDDQFRSLISTYNNLYAFVGYTKSMGDLKGDCWIVKTQLNGDSIFSLKYGNGNIQFLNDVAEEPSNNNLVTCGATDIDGRDSTYAYIMVVDQNGVYQYANQYSYHNMLDAQFNSVASLKPNLLVYLRKQFNSTGGRKLEPMITINNPIWEILGGLTTYGSTEDDDLYDVFKTRDKGFVCIGYTKGFSSNLTDVYLIKIDSNYNAIAAAPSAVGINEVQANDNLISVYPTLTNDAFEVIIPSITSGSKITITNAVGQILEETRIKQENALFHLGNYKSGVYFITILHNNKIVNFKVIKND